MDYKIAISSYKRVDILTKKTFKLLQKYNVDEKKIYIFVAPNEVDLYRNAFPNVNIVKSFDNFLKTKIHMLKYWKSGTKLITMDDDITTIVKLVNGKLKPISSFTEMSKMIFDKMKETDTRLAGFYPVANSGFMEKAIPITTDLRYIFGTLRYWIVDNKILPTNSAKEDFEMSILYYNKYGGVLRFNHYAYRSNYMGGDGGRKREKDSKDSDAFIKKYGAYISKVITHKDGTTSFLLKKNP